MTKRSQAHSISNVIFVVLLFAVGGLMIIPNLGFASPSSSGADQGAANMHLDEAMKALQAGDAAGAELHMTEADKVLQEGEAKTHLDEAIKALQAGDSSGAEMHAQLAKDSL